MNKTYTQPFETGTLNCERFRIPALYTLVDGSVLAGADVRYGHGADSPNNIDITLARSQDGYTDWQYTIVNHFDDYADGATGKDSASFIDSAIVQTATGRIIVITDMFPSQGGYLQAKKGTGYADIDGKKRLLLTDGKNSENLRSFGYFVGDMIDGKAPVFNRKDKTETAYSIDENYRLYKNGEPVFCAQKGADRKQVQQNVFYSAADLQIYRTVYLCMRYSDDNGKTWSKPVLLSDQLKKNNENFFGICPGRGKVITHNGKERILFCVYNNHGLIDDPICENASAIYSDDNGNTWHRSKKIALRPGLTKTSESQLVELQAGGKKVLRMYARNNSNYIAFADSTDDGETWTQFKADPALEGTKNCMVSFLDTKRIIDGKQVILASAGGSIPARADGVLRVGLVENNAHITWIHTYRVNQGFYAYSCLTALPDGNFGLLYEDEPAHIQYMVFAVSDKGEITEINGNNCTFTINPTEKEQKMIKSKRRNAKIRFNLGLL
ncbi:MAG: exo-alpha-sialidase [Clostridia bacterium]|nr:exo-alpha-sialidase [Clostridia bacterium]